MGFSVNQRNSLRSPHVRGKDTRRQRDDSVRGITPACAGKRTAGIARSSEYGDHPRVCGEKFTTSRVSGLAIGSPPRVRGKGLCDQRQHVVQGITPACAGKRPSDRQVRPDVQDHPRVCGEKTSFSDGSYPCRGSPPRVRGKAGGLYVAPLSRGITPACAGKRRRASGSGAISRDHPRVCGEKGAGTGAEAHRLGSPPRVRGKVFASGQT